MRSANITPDPRTGIGGWSRDQFISRFKAWIRDPEPVAPGNFNTVMPWARYAHDQARPGRHLRLRTVPAVDYEIVRFTPSE